MLTDKREIEIIANARQANVRDPKRSREHFFNIIDDFFDGVELTGMYVDLGPGQYDFGEIVRQQGGDCVGVDFDPAVIELGRFKGFRVVEGNIRQLRDLTVEGGPFDGVFNKFSLNAFWTRDDTEHRQLVDAVANLVASDGWAWIGPWNGVPKAENLEPEEIDRVLSFQRACFESRGFQVVELTDRLTRRYGIHGAVANNIVFVKNLNWRPTGNR